MKTLDAEWNKKKLMSDYNQLLKDARALMASLPGELDERGMEAKEQLEETLEGFKDRYGLVEEQIQDQVKKTDKLIHDYPYHSAGIALGIGLLAGLLIRK